MIHVLQLAVLMAFPILVIAAGVKDVTSYTIPNWIPLALLASFPVAAIVLGLPFAALGLQLAVGAAALLLGVAMFAAGWIGGGDAKLFAAAGLWLGWPAALPYVACTGLAGGALAVILLGLRSAAVRPFVPSGPAWLTRLVEPGENVPYGLAIAVGALVAFPNALIATLH